MNSYLSSIYLWPFPRLLGILMVISRVTDDVAILTVEKFLAVEKKYWIKKHSLISTLNLTIWLKILSNSQPWAMCLIFDLDPDPEKKTPASSWLHHKFENRVAANIRHFALFCDFHAWDWLLDQNVLNWDFKMVSITRLIIIKSPIAYHLTTIPCLKRWNPSKCTDLWCDVSCSYWFK